jgi:hypothetical protein
MTKIVLHVDHDHGGLVPVDHDVLGLRRQTRST